MVIICVMFILFALFLVILLVVCIKVFPLKKQTINMEMCMSETPLVNSLEMPLDFSDFKKEKCIGKGSFGTVFLCSLPPDFKRKFALKHLNSIKNEVN